MQQKMLSSLNSRYTEVESNGPLFLATILDPRFKAKFFSGSTQRTNAKTVLER